MVTEIDEGQPTRRSLVLRLRNLEDQEIWQDFFNTYWKLLYCVASKAGLDEAAAQDVVQDTVICVAKSIHTFRYARESSSFKSWLLTITRRRIIDHFRRQQARPLPARCGADREAATPWLDRLPDPQTLEWQNLWDTEWEKNLFEAALANVKRRVRPLQYQIFDCFVFKKWPARVISGRLRVSLAQVYFARCKLTSLLRKEVQRLKKELM